MTTDIRRFFDFTDDPDNAYDAADEEGWVPSYDGDLQLEVLARLAEATKEA